MAKVEKSIVIDAPVEKVFEYVMGPTNLLEVWPSLVDIKDVESLPNGGNRYRWVYKMAGMRLEGTGEDTEIVVNQRIVASNSGSGMKSTIAWNFHPEGAGTRVVLVGEYTIPVPLLGKLAEPFIVRQNEQEAELLLSNLKARLET